MQASQRRAEIAGAGIAGLTAAAALAQRGWAVRVHEHGPALRATGAGIFVYENGLRVLEAIGAYDDATRGAFRGVRRDTRNERNEVVAQSELGGQRIYTIVRQHLLQALAAAARRAGVDIVTGSQAVSAHPGGLLRLADGTEIAADLVVAADGVNSRCRDALGLLRSRRVLADGATRLLIPRTERERHSAEGQAYREYWSGTRRIIYAPCSETEVYLALTALDADTDAKAVPVQRDAWTRSFPFLADLFGRIDGQGRWDRFEVIRLHRWSAGQAAVIGDAAHALAPNLGQGGGCSMMGALGLAVALDGVDIPAGLAAWEARERPLVEHTQRVSSLYSAITAWPPLLRSWTLGLAGRSRWATAQRLRTANHVPTGTLGWQDAAAGR